MLLVYVVLAYVVPAHGRQFYPYSSSLPSPSTPARSP